MPEVQETQVRSLGWDKSLGGGNVNPLQHSCWKNPMEEEPGGIQSVGSQRVRHNWAHTHTRTHTHTHTHTRLVVVWGHLSYLVVSELPGPEIWCLTLIWEILRPFCSKYFFRSRLSSCTPSTCMLQILWLSLSPWIHCFVFQSLFLLLLALVVCPEISSSSDSFLKPIACVLSHSVMSDSL